MAEYETISISQADIRKLQPEQMSLAPKVPHSCRNRQLTLRYGQIAILIITIFTFFTYFYYNFTLTSSALSLGFGTTAEEVDGHDSGLPHSICGTNSRTAQRNNCTFDPIAFSWLPAKCFDEDLLGNFLQNRDWTWHYSQRSTSMWGRPAVLPFDEVLSGRYDSVSVNQEFLKLQCMYLNAKRERASMAGPAAWTDTYSAKRETECIMKGHLSGLPSRIDRTLATLDVKFPFCYQPQSPTGGALD